MNAKDLKKFLDLLGDRVVTTDDQIKDLERFGVDPLEYVAGTVDPNAITDAIIICGTGPAHTPSRDVKCSFCGTDLILALSSPQNARVSCLPCAFKDALNEKEDA